MKINWGGDWQNLKGRFRVEYNPTKMSWKMASLLRFLRKKAKINLRLNNDYKITRLDWAIDIPYYIADLEYSYKDGVKRFKCWREGGDVETEYFGARSSDTMFRIYNKALEEGSEGVKTRIECQSRQEFIISRPLEYFNPFKELNIYYKEGLFEDYYDIPLEYKALLYYLKANPKEYKNLGRKRKEKLKEYEKYFKEQNYKKIELVQIVQRDYQRCIKDLQKDLGVVV